MSQKINEMEEYFDQEQLREVLNSLREEYPEENEVVIDFDKIKSAWDQVKKPKIFGTN